MEKTLCFASIDCVDHLTNAFKIVYQEISLKRHIIEQKTHLIENKSFILKTGYKWKQINSKFCAFGRHTHGSVWFQYPSVMPSAHCDSNGSSGSGDQMPDFDGVHDLDDAGSLLEHNNTDCGQPMLMPFQFNRTKTHTHPHSGTIALPHTNTHTAPDWSNVHTSRLRSIKKPDFG